MIGRDYKVRHSLPGRLRLEFNRKLKLDGIGAGLEKLPGVTRVSINPVLNTLLIYYEPGQTDQKTVLSKIPAPRGVVNHTRWTDDGISRKDLFWSLLAGVLLLTAHNYRRNAAKGSVKYLDYLAAGVTGYAVLSHRDVVNCGDKSLHLDTLAGLFSILSLEGDRALMGVFVTWLLNFIEVVFGWPGYSSKCAVLAK